MTPKVSLDFEAFSLPPGDVLRLYGQPRARFGDDSFTGDPNETLRKNHRAFPFSNQELEACLDVLEQNDWPSLLYFIIGLPTETRADIMETAVPASPQNAVFEDR